MNSVAISLHFSSLSFFTRFLFSFFLSLPLHSSSPCFQNCHHQQHHLPSSSIFDQQHLHFLFSSSQSVGLGFSTSSSLPPASITDVIHHHQWSTASPSSEHSFIATITVPAAPLVTVASPPSSSLDSSLVSPLAIRDHLLPTAASIIAWKQPIA